MFTEYSYEIEGPAVVIRGTLQVEFEYAQGYSGGLVYVEPSVDVLRAVADSAEIVDGKDRIVGMVELLAEGQRARWGAAVLADCWGAVEEACVEAGREHHSYTRADYESDRADMAHSDGERN